MNNDQFMSITRKHEEYINSLSVIVNDWATKKGWNETPDSVQHKAEQIALMHSELSECLEFVRKKMEPVCPLCNSTDLRQFSKATGQAVCQFCFTHVTPHNPPVMDDHVPSLTGEAAELADVLIRIFHYCGKRNINLGEAVRLKHEYNVTRPYRHGKNI